MTDQVPDEVRSRISASLQKYYQTHQYSRPASTEETKNKISSGLRAYNTTTNREYQCLNGCGRVLRMPGSVTRHLRTCVVNLDQLKTLAGVIDVGEDQCWIWKGLAENERPKICFTSPVTGTIRRRYGYVIAFILATNTDPEVSGKLVCHTCDDGRCINPSHLWMGTNADNLHDMSVKGRAGGFRKMDPVRHREIASQGGIRAQQLAEAHRHSIGERF